MGMYIFEPEVLNYIPKGDYFDFPDLVHALLNADEPVSYYKYDGYWKDLGNNNDYMGAVEDFEAMRSQFLGE